MDPPPQTGHLANSSKATTVVQIPVARVPGIMADRWAVLRNIRNFCGVVANLEPLVDPTSEIRVLRISGPRPVQVRQAEMWVREGAGPN